MKKQLFTAMFAILATCQINAAHITFEMSNLNLFELTTEGPNSDFQTIPHDLPDTLEFTLEISPEMLNRATSVRDFGFLFGSPTAIEGFEDYAGQAVILGTQKTNTTFFDSVEMMPEFFLNSVFDDFLATHRQANFSQQTISTSNEQSLGYEELDIFTEFEERVIQSNRGFLQERVTSRVRFDHETLEQTSNNENGVLTEQSVRQNFSFSRNEHVDLFPIGDTFATFSDLSESLQDSFINQESFGFEQRISINEFRTENGMSEQTQRFLSLGSSARIVELNLVTVPEPTSLLLFLAGLTGVVRLRKK